MRWPLIARMAAHAALAAAFAVCGAAPAADCAPVSRRIRIVATAFPHYDWTRQIIGGTESAELSLLQRGGVDMHSYSPSAADIRLIASCDMFIFVGGASDAWAGRVLSIPGNPRRRVVNLMKSLGEAGACNADEHVWLSLRNAAALTRAIAAELSAAAPAIASAYRANAEAYCARLESLDRAYADAVAKAARRTILVADRFPFHHLVHDYGIGHFAAFDGCSAESETSFKTIARLAGKVDELRLPVILTTEDPGRGIAETVRNATREKNQRIMALCSLQSMSGKDAGATRYIDVMKRNLETLKAALN